MKRILLTSVMLLMAPLVVKAQNLWVYASNGSVEVFSEGAWCVAEPYKHLAPTDSVRFGVGSSITILDHKNDRLYAIQKEGSHQVDTIVQEAKARSKKQPKGVISYLWDSLRGKNSADEYRNPAGVVYRDDDINAAIANAVIAMTSSLPVEFELMDEENGSVVGEVAPAGNIAIVKVKNHSLLDLFVNVIDIDANGMITACIPVDSAWKMAQLFIPAGSEVLLNSFPIVFTEPKGVDELILVASPEWFDIDAVVANMKNGKASAKKVDVGIIMQRLIVF